MRTFIGATFIKIGMAILPADVRKLTRDILMYHVPGGLTPAEKAEVRSAKAAWVHDGTGI